MGGQGAVYDAHADWYDDYVNGPAAEHTRRTSGALTALLGTGSGVCLDLGCGSGVHAPIIRSLGWQVIGCDLSWRQLRHARARLPATVADAAALPIRTASLDVVAATLIHTDVEDWHSTVREVARVLRPGGRFVYVGVHPCFVGPFVQRVGETVTIHPGYAQSELAFHGPGIGRGVRQRVGVRHRRIADLLGAALAAGLVLTRIDESGAGSTPDLLAFGALAPLR